MSQPMIEVENVSMRFNMAKEKVDSIKEMFIRRAKGTLKFEEFFALTNVSLRVEKGDVFGLVGLNGSGKSTLCKIIAGVMKPSQGSCRVYGSVAPLIELGAGFDPDLTARENVFLNGTVLGMKPSYLEERFDEIVEFSELHDFLDVAVKNYSSGMVARLAFSVATIMDPDVLICDEILSVGDFLFKEKCEKRISEMIERGTTVLLVSHDIGIVEQLCNKACWLSHGHVIAQGDCAGVVNDYQENAHIGFALEKESRQPEPREKQYVASAAAVKICEDEEIG
ncbi:ABC transporter ATP-binding protein [Ruminococcaceae bacterium OttesenSCG-928-I18]|nr:ABC transporter ATP-binding protein [Ruminococcaceae bacterium OttesenSCG-928-I18]